jgi:hypothetical protein
MEYVYDSNKTLTTGEDTHVLLSTGSAVADEELDVDDPIIQMNFREVLGKIIQESSQTWKVIWYLLHLREICPGFEYHIIKKYSQGQPEGMC